MPLRNGTKNVNAALRPVSLPGKRAKAKDASSPVYTPTITLRIPADIPTNKHAEVIAKINAARATLANRISLSREGALQMAANALSESGAGACGYPTVTKQQSAQDASPVFNLTPVPMPAGQRNQPRQAATPADDLAPITTKYATPPPKPRPMVSHVFKSPEETKAAYRLKTQEELKHGFGKDGDRPITQNDLNDAARGLRMLGMSPDELRDVIKQHDGKDMFMSKVIVASAKQMLAAKLRMGAKDTRDAISRAMDAEVHGQRLTALKHYRAAATDARAKGDTAKLQLATDGIAQCQAPVVPTWQHPGYGKSKAYDTAEHALEAAVLRTRAGERVRVLDSKVVPAMDADSPFSKGEAVRNVYGETGVVVEQNGTTVVVRPDRHTGSTENWHADKTHLLKLKRSKDEDDDTAWDHPDAVYKKPQPWQDVRKGKDVSPKLRWKS